MKHEPFKQFAAFLALAVTLAAPAVAMEAPEGVVYCGGDPEQQIEFVIRPYTGEQWNASMTIDGQRVRAMSSYSYFGRQKEPDGFVGHSSLAVTQRYIEGDAEARRKIVELV